MLSLPFLYYHALEKVMHAKVLRWSSWSQPDSYMHSLLRLQAAFNKQVTGKKVQKLPKKFRFLPRRLERNINKMKVVPLTRHGAGCKIWWNIKNHFRFLGKPSPNCTKSLDLQRERQAALKQHPWPTFWPTLQPQNHEDSLKVCERIFILGLYWLLLYI